MGNRPPLRQRAVCVAGAATAVLIALSTATAAPGERVTGPPDEAPVLYTALPDITVTTSAGTRLRVVESGFDKIPGNRRAEAFRMNDGGWSAQLDNIARHLDHAS